MTPQQRTSTPEQRTRRCVCVCVCKGETNDTTKEGVVTVANECAVALLFDPLWLMFLVLGDSYGIGGSYTRQHRARPRKSCLGGARLFGFGDSNGVFLCRCQVPVCVCVVHPV